MLAEKKNFTKGFGSLLPMRERQQFCWGSFSTSLIGFGGSFSDKRVLHGGSFFMKVVHSSNERELKLNVTAVNCKHRSYNCYNCYKHDCR